MIILVLNQGLKSTRCIAFSFDGSFLTESSRKIDTIINKNFIEQDPLVWENLAYEVVNEVVQNLGNKSKDIKYITVTTSASCLVPVDSNHNSLCNSILVSDTRAMNQAAKISNLDEFIDVALDTDMKSSSDLMIPKILWIKENKTKIFDNTQYFLNAGDYLNLILTGVCLTDINNALKFHFSVNNFSYPIKLLEKLNINLNTLPPVGEIGSLIGPIKKNISHKLNLPPTCKVLLSTYDALAAVTGAGCQEIGDAVDVSGTVTSLRVISDKYIKDSLNRVYVSPHQTKNQWLVGGSNNLGGGVVEWLKHLQYSDSVNPYLDIENDAKSVAQCPNGAIFLPHLLGERAPIWDEHCRAVFFGLSRNTTKKELTKIVLEGIGFSARHIGKVINSFDISISKITLSGGLARIDAVSQIKSDIFGKPIIKLKSFETTSIGAAILCLVAVNEFSSMKEAFNSFTSVEKIFEPDIKRYKIYDEFFELYVNVYESLSGPYKLRQTLSEKYYESISSGANFKDNL